MWTPSFHRFATEADFLAACDAAGWPRDHQARPAPPASMALDIIGSLAAPPTILEGGAMTPGAVDARFHVNALWQGDMPAAWAASVITPSSPTRAFAVRVAPPPQPQYTPDEVPAWKGRIVLAESGLLATVEAAIAAAPDRIKVAWAHKPTWRRNSQMITAMAAAVNLSNAQVRALFRDADAIEG